MRFKALVLVLLFAGCAGSSAVSDGGTVQPAAPAVSGGGAVQPATPAVADEPGATRPIPHPVTVPPAFEDAIQRGTRTTTGAPGPDYWVNEAAYEMTARVLPAERRLEGSGTITYTNHSPYQLSELRLELTQNFHRAGAARLEPAEVTGGVELERIAVDGRELAGTPMAGAHYVVDETQLVLRPQTPLAPGGTATIEISWSFDIPQQGAGARMGYSRDNLFFLAYWYPQMSVFDDVHGWFTDPFLGTTEFYAGFADYDVTIEAPSGWIISATGALENAEEVLRPEVVERMRRAHASDVPVVVVEADGSAEATRAADESGFLRWRFEAENVRDFAFAATSASIWEAARTPVGDRDGDGAVDYVQINTFYRPTAPLWDDVTRYQQHAITFHSDFTDIPYPWPHMTAVEGAPIIGGGMEFPMITLMGDYETRGDSALYNVTAHELAHMWVPMIVSTNERWFSWLDEGFTTWLENQARRDFFPGPNHEAGDRLSYLVTAQRGIEGEMMRRSPYHYVSTAYFTASYSKPATVLSALRAVLGEEVFMRAYQEFLQSWAYRHPYPNDFFNTVERVSGRDLDWFWRTWYYETWTLDQAIASVEAGDGRAEIVVADLGLAPMPVDLVVTLASGETIRRTIPVDVWLRGAREATVTIEASSRVVGVAIDPENDFPDIDRSNNVWRRS